MHDAQSFIEQHVSPLLYRTTQGAVARRIHEIDSEQEFWESGVATALSTVSIEGFRLTDWFPRAPGVYWSRQARSARSEAWAERPHTTAKLGAHYSPTSKSGLIVEGGIGCIRLRPRPIDGCDCWFATAIKGVYCHSGIPLALPAALLDDSGVQWGDHVNIVGRVRFLQDVGLTDAADSVHNASPFIVVVDEISRAHNTTTESIIVTPVALFSSLDDQTHDYYHSNLRYTFVQCQAGSTRDLESAADWIATYAETYGGRIVTNYDEQRPAFANAPLSYQRLVAKTYDAAVIQQFFGRVEALQIDKLVQSIHVETMHMGHKISVGGSAIINIDAVLMNVSQEIQASPGMDAAQKMELESLVASMRADLDRIKTEYAEETKAITDALETAVANAARPPQERKKSILQLSANGLREAASLVKDVAPSILATAGLIAKFITGL